MCRTCNFLSMCLVRQFTIPERSASTLSPCPFALIFYIIQTVPTPRSFHRVVTMWLSKENLTNQAISGGQDNKVVSTTPALVDAIPGKKAYQPLPLKALLIPPVLIAALNYAALALVDISSRAIQPVFYSTPIELGGLGLPPHHIGKILSVYGILNGILQIFFFAKTQARFGAKNVYLAGIASSLLVFVSFPVINCLARKAGGHDWLVWLAVGFQVVSSIFINFSYGGFPSHLLHRMTYQCIFRLYIHLHYRLFSEPRIARICKWSRSTKRIYNARSWPCTRQFTFLTINRPGSPLPRWISRLLGIVGFSVLCPRRRLLLTRKGLV